MKYLVVSFVAVLSATSAAEAEVRYFNCSGTTSMTLYRPDGTPAQRENFSGSYFWKLDLGRGTAELERLPYRLVISDARYEMLSKDERGAYNHSIDRYTGEYRSMYDKKVARGHSRLMITNGECSLADAPSKKF